MKQARITWTRLISIFTLGLGASPAIASSDDATTEGYGERGSTRVTLVAGMTSGTRPSSGTGTVPAPGAPAVPAVVAEEDYKRLSSWLTLEYHGFWDKTRFDTLVGGEVLVGLGYFPPEKADPERASEPSAGWTKFHGKFEGAFDYAPIHWEGKFAGRFVFGAGVGGEFGSYWHTEDGRAYPLVLSRLQLLPSSMGLEATYRFIPTTTGNNAVREHRLGGALTLSRFQVGAEVVWLKVHVPDQRWLNSTTLHGTLGMFF